MIWPQVDSFDNDHAMFYLKFGIEFEYLDRISAIFESSDRQLGSNFRTILNFRFSTHLHLIEPVIFKTCWLEVLRIADTFKIAETESTFCSEGLKLLSGTVTGPRSDNSPSAAIDWRLNVLFQNGLNLDSQPWKMPEITLRQSSIYSCCVNPIKEIA